LGTLDESLALAKFVPSADTAIEVIRKARQEQLNLHAKVRVRRELARKFFTETNFEELAKSVLQLTSGMLLFDSDADYSEASSQIDTIEQLILHANDKTYLAARNLFWKMVERGFEIVVERCADLPDARKLAVDRLIRSAKGDPKTACNVFAGCLFLAAKPQKPA
jgi:hypothetical protein